jgi:hypothetical protein
MSAMHSELGEFVDRDTIRFVRRYPHPVELVWEMLTEPKHLEAWFMTAQLDWRVGGRFAFGSCRGSSPSRCHHHARTAHGHRVRQHNDAAGLRLRRRHRAVEIRTRLRRRRVPSGFHAALPG